MSDTELAAYVLQLVQVLVDLTHATGHQHATLRSMASTTLSMLLKKAPCAAALDVLLPNVASKLPIGALHRCCFDWLPRLHGLAVANGRARQRVHRSAQ